MFSADTFSFETSNNYARNQYGFILWDLNLEKVTFKKKYKIQNKVISYQLIYNLTLKDFKILKLSKSITCYLRKLKEK